MGPAARSSSGRESQAAAQDSALHPQHAADPLAAERRQLSEGQAQSPTPRLDRNLGLAGDIVHEYFDGVSESGLLKRAYGRSGIETGYTYDFKGRVQTKTRDYGGTSLFAHGYGYDSLDRNTMTTLPNGAMVFRGYDASQLNGISVLDGTTYQTLLSATDLESHQSGGLASIRLSALGQPDVLSTYGHRPSDHRLGSALVVHDPGGAAQEEVQNTAYSYDVAGNLVASTDGLPVSQLTQTFGYDSVHRLSTVTATGALGYGIHSYVYDEAGNILEKGAIGAPAGEGRLRLHYARTAAKPTSVAAIDKYSAVSSSWTDNFATYAYDEDGGAIDLTVLGFSRPILRDVEGRATVIMLPFLNQTAIYHYDHTGERSEKLVLVNGLYGLIHDSRYYVDADFEVDSKNDEHEGHIFVGTRRLATMKWDGVGNEAGATLESTVFYHADQVGSNTITTVNTSSSQTVQRAVTDPFGGKVPGGTSPTAYLFTDQERDGETGFDYFGARFYDSFSGRFLSQDPELIGGHEGLTFGRIGSEPQSANPYTYVYNRPTSLIDPTGEITIGVPGTTYFQGTKTVHLTTASAADAAGIQLSGSGGSGGVSAPQGSDTSVGAAATGAAAASGPASSQGGGESTGQTGPSPAFVAGVATNAAGLAVGGGEIANVQGGQWRASNALKDGTRPFYDQRFHGNQYTGGRNAVLSRGAAFRFAGRAFFGLGTALSIGDAYQGNISPVQAGQDVTFGAIGTFGGPLGLLVSGSYFGSQAAVEFLGLDPAALRAAAPQPSGY